MYRRGGKPSLLAEARRRFAEKDLGYDVASAACYDSNTGGVCTCEEYACPTAAMSATGRDQIAETPAAARGSQRLKVLSVRVLEPRV